MIFGDFIEKDVTLHTIHGHIHRGVLKEIHDTLLEFQVGIDVLFILADSVYAVTEHGIQRTDFADI